MVSLEGLTKVVDPSQLTADFDGSLDYNHEEWIEVRPGLSFKPISLIEKSIRKSLKPSLTFKLRRASLDKRRKVEEAEWMCCICYSDAS